MANELIPAEGRIELTYAYHTIDGTRFICGRHLAGQLVEDAMKLLVPACKGDVNAAWDDLWKMAAPVACRLDDEAKAGKLPGLVLTVGDAIGGKAKRSLG